MPDELKSRIPRAAARFFARRGLPAAPLRRRAPGKGAREPGFLVPGKWWAASAEELLRALASSPGGLSSNEASRRLDVAGRNELRPQKPLSPLGALLEQLRSPLLLLLVFAAVTALATGEALDALIILGIIAASVGIGWSREYSARKAIDALRARVRSRAKVLRDGVLRTIPASSLVPGDVLLLSAGALVPADGVLLEAEELHIGEAVLTGESFPARKSPGRAEPEAPLARRANCVFMGTSVHGGGGRMLAVRTGAATQFGAVAGRLMLRPPETEFDRGLRRFGAMLTSAMLLMTLAVFAAHMLRGRPPAETLLFAVALAVGLSPELLPAILSVNLARGAQGMARAGVLVRRLKAIENLGSMDLLCTDKTGTLTEGIVRLEGAYDARGRRDDAVLELGALNAAFETGLANPLDDAILEARKPDLSGLRKLAEIPFDFVRRRVSVVVAERGRRRLIAKGAFHSVAEACAGLTRESRERLERLHKDWSAQGVRVLAVAERELPEKDVYLREDEEGLEFRGFLAFLDRPKEGVAEALAGLSRLGVSVRLITGDNRLVAAHVARAVGLGAQRVLTGGQLDRMGDEALWHAAERTELFVEVDPRQKERIILALKKTGHVVGFLGDGVNDAPAMHAADVSLSVEGAVDAARDAADFVLLRRHLDVIRQGIQEGRRTFANTLKYVMTTTSANLGNMLSMAAASFFLPFLPLLASQILLNNLLSDIPAFALAGDRVDSELVDRPRRWDMGFIGSFMVEFGLLSSAFDLLTFAGLLWLFHAVPETFRTAWFVESLLTELAVALVVRTRRRFYESRPGGLLLGSTLLMIPLAYALPFFPGAGLFGFVPLSGAQLLLVTLLTAAYVFCAEAMKSWFYRGMP